MPIYLDGLPLRADPGYWRYTFKDDAVYPCVNNPNNCHETLQN